MSAHPKIKIFISCNEDCYVPDNQLFSKINVGSALKQNKFSNVMTDDTGENISHKYNSYGQLTAQYWAWHNDKADYYGFFGYNRYLSFAIQQDNKHLPAKVDEPYLDNYVLDKYGIEENLMHQLISQYDVVLPYQSSLGSDHTVYDYYKDAEYHIISDLDFVLNIIKRDYPQMYKYACRYVNGNRCYLGNIFVMKQAIFEQYSQWLFDILQKHEKAIDISNYGAQQYKVHSYLAEIMLGIYVTYLTRTQKINILHLQTVQFADTTQFAKILPAFDQNNIAVVMASNDYYSPYLSTLLQSIVENSSIENNYDIFVLTNNISKHNQCKLIKQLELSNFSLRFVDVGRFMTAYQHLPLRGHFKLETYFRFLLPEILTEYDKVLYLDSDMVVCDDVAKLFNHDIKGYLLGACLDADSAGLYNGFEKDKKFYIDNILALSKPYEYFQAGTILFNLEEFRKTYTVHQMMQFACAYPWELLDQDVLNYFAQGKVCFIDMAWNVMVDWARIRISKIISLAPTDLYEQYITARKAPKIIHYAGPDKPWDFPDSDLAEAFWHYARKSPYYEVILHRCTINQSIAISQQQSKEQRMHKLRKVFFIRWIVDCVMAVRRRKMRIEQKKQYNHKLAMQQQFLQNREHILQIVKPKQ